MKAVAVIQEYKNGRRDFRSQSLRGCNFKNQELSGADLSGCDIRGANFNGANLTEAKFEKAKAGLRKRSVVILLLVTLVLMLFSSVFSTIYSHYISFMFDKSSMQNQIASWVSLIFLLFFCVLTRKSTLTGLVTGLAITGLTVVTITASSATLSFIAAAMTIAAPGMAIGAGLTTVIALSSLVALGIKKIIVVALAILIVLGVSLGAKMGIIGVTVAVTLTLFFCYIGWLTLKQEYRDPWLRRIVIAFAGLDGTSFFQANLTATDFTGATLKSTNFNQAILNKTIFKQAIKLELARPGKTLLVNPQVRELLINPSTGADQDLTKADLRGANLDGANLQKADLQFADLSQASFKYANLREANLTEVNAVNADLSHATLTGACVENWNIDATTQLAEVDCQYIYLLNNQKERRPSSGEFEPGEFTKLFAEVFDTVDLIFRQGVDWKAFTNAMKQVQVQNGRC